MELPAGSYSFTATATDAEGNTSAPSQALVVVVDIETPAPSGLDLIAASDTGTSSTDNVTSDTTPTITGTAEAAAKVELSDGTNVLGTATADADGFWTITSSELTDNIYSLTATATDLAANTSTVSAALVVEIDSTLDGPTANYVYGTDGSDPAVNGTTGDDIISGLADGSTKLGSGTIDILFGDAGNDVFVLGDSRGAYYNDDKGRPDNGTSDYGQINDFISGEDQIQLFGTAADYLLHQLTLNGVTGTGIFMDFKGEGSFDSQDELIGLVQDSFPGSPALDLLSSQFSFVSSDDLLV